MYSLKVKYQEERKRRSEELQAKEDAVQERKLAIEADRLARIAHIEDKIKESQAKVHFPIFRTLNSESLGGIHLAVKSL